MFNKGIVRWNVFDKYKEKVRKLNIEITIIFNSAKHF